VAGVVNAPAVVTGAASRTVTRAAAGMGVATAVSRAFGFLRVLAIAAILGTTYLGNTFQSSNSVSNVLFELIAAGALSAVLVPTFVELFERADDAEVERLAGGLLGLSGVVLGVVSVIGVVAAPWLASLLTVGVHDAQIAAQQRELTTFLLRFFVPQVVLYAFGAITIAVLQAKRRFAVGAVAPIGNTVVMVAALLVFRLLYGPGEPGLTLTFAERLALALGGTLGVAAFVAIPAIAARRGGLRWRLHVPRHDPAVRRLLRLSAWAVLLHVGIGLLLGAAIVVGNGVEGGVVAYQVAFVFFLAPYAVLAQPVHTAILPELSVQASGGAWTEFATSIRWALDRIAVWVIPSAAALIAFSEPIMRIASFGKASSPASVDLLAAALASLALGLFAYSAFLLLARACYALGDSRTPALVGLAAALTGVVIMIAGAPATHGAARVALLGLAHTAAYTVGAGVSVAVLSRRLGQPIVPPGLAVIAGSSAVLALLGWAVMQVIDPSGRAATALTLAGVGGGLAAVFAVGMRFLRPSPNVDGVPAGGA